MNPLREEAAQGDFNSGARLPCHHTRNKHLRSGDLGARSRCVFLSEDWVLVRAHSPGHHRRGVMLGAGSSASGFLRAQNNPLSLQKGIFPYDHWKHPPENAVRLLPQLAVPILQLCRVILEHQAVNR